MLANVIKKSGEMAQVNEIRNKIGEIMKNITINQVTITNYFTNLYDNKLKNSEEIDWILDKFELPKLNEEALKPPNNQIIGTKIE